MRSSRLLGAGASAEVAAGGPSWRRTLLAAGLGALAATSGMAQDLSHGHDLVERPGLDLAAGAAWNPAVRPRPLLDAFECGLSEGSRWVLAVRRDTAWGHSAVQMRERAAWLWSSLAVGKNRIIFIRGRKELSVLNYAQTS